MKKLPEINLNSKYMINNLLFEIIKNSSGVEKIKTVGIKEVIKHFIKNGEVDSLTFTPLICRQHQDKSSSKFSQYVKSIIFALQPEYRYCNSTEEKMHTIRISLIIEKLVTNKSFISPKNKNNKDILVDLVGNYIHKQDLDNYYNYAQDLVDYNFMQFSKNILNSLEILESNSGNSNILIDYHSRNTYANDIVSIFKIFKNKKLAHDYVRNDLLQEIKKQAKSDDIVNTTTTTTAKVRKNKP